MRGAASGVGVRDGGAPVAELATAPTVSVLTAGTSPGGISAFDVVDGFAAGFAAAAASTGGCATTVADSPADFTPAGTVVDGRSFGVTTGTIVGLTVATSFVALPRDFGVVSLRLKNADTAAVASQ